MPRLNQSLIFKHLHQLVKDQNYLTAVFQEIQTRERNNYFRSQLIIRLTMHVAKDRELLLNLLLRHPLNPALALNLVCQHSEHIKLLCTILDSLDRRLYHISPNLRLQRLCNRTNQFKKEPTYSQMFLSQPQMLYSGVI